MTQAFLKLTVFSEPYIIPTGKLTVTQNGDLLNRQDLIFKEERASRAHASLVCTRKALLSQDLAQRQRTWNGQCYNHSFQPHRLNFGEKKWILNACIQLWYSELEMSLFPSRNKNKNKPLRESWPLFWLTVIVSLYTSLSVSLLIL